MDDAYWPAGLVPSPAPGVALEDDFDTLMTQELIESPREPAMAASVVDDVARRLNAGEIVEMPLVHQLLRNVVAGVVPYPEALQLKASASPFAPFDVPHCCYLVSRARASARAKKDKKDEPKAAAAAPTVSVAFQSALNGEVWWSARSPLDGVVARPMARRVRTGSAAGRAHGYRGRLYTLVVRVPSGPPTADKHADLGLVQIWKDAEAAGPPGGAAALRPGARGGAVAPLPDDAPHHRKRAKAYQSGDEASDGEYSASHRSTLSCGSSRDDRGADRRDSPPGDHRLLPPPSDSESEHCAGEPPLARLKRSRSEPGQNYGVFDRDCRFKRDIFVEGTIHGVVRSPVEAADYAEWFLWHHDLLEREAPLPPPGSVVTLRTSDQCIALETTSKLGPCLVVSTTPSIAAGVPKDDLDKRCGALVAFLGQVPVRCVGPVECGDQLVPSGRDDGTAVARHRTLGGFENRNDVLGVALSSGGFDGDAGKDLEAGGRREHVVLCFVRWNQAVTREIHVAVDAAVKAGTEALSVAMFWSSAFLVVASCALTTHMAIRAANGRRHPSDRYLQPGPKHAQVQTFVSFLIALDHLCLYVLIALYGTAMPHLTLVVLQWLVGFATIPVIWAYWTAVGQALLYAFCFYLVALRVTYYALLLHSAHVIRRDGVAPPAMKDWQRCLPKRCARAISSLWAPVTIVVIFVFCLFSNSTVYIEK